MTSAHAEGPARPAGPGPPPAARCIDEAALVAARAADRAPGRRARARGDAAGSTYLEPLPDRLRDEDIVDLRRTALRVRAAYGPKDSVRDVLPESVTEPFLDAIDRLLKALAKREVAGG